MARSTRLSNEHVVYTLASLLALISITLCWCDGLNHLICLQLAVLDRLAKGSSVWFLQGNVSFFSGCFSFLISITTLNKKIFQQISKIINWLNYFYSVFFLFSIEWMNMWPIHMKSWFLREGFCFMHKDTVRMNKWMNVNKLVKKLDQEWMNEWFYWRNCSVISSHLSKCHTKGYCACG